MFERAIFERLYNFLKNGNVLYKKQFGFQLKRSATDARIEITESSLFVQKKFTWCILTDIKKKFDTSDDSKSLQKILNMVLEELH